MSYLAVVTQIKVRPHPNADKIQIGSCFDKNVIVGLDTQDGDLGVYFDTDGQLSDEFVRANSLYNKSALEKLEIPFGPHQHFGFFDVNRRVRAQSFRGVKSEGFWLPVNCLDFAGKDTVKVGDTFDTMNGIPICNKYLTRATRNASGKVGRKQRENKCFPKHDVSKKWKFVSRDIPDGSVCWITEKLHGTSGRYGRVLDVEDISGWSTWKLLWNGFLFGDPKPTYRYLNGSKNVILEKSTGAGWYGTNDFRYKAVEGVALHKGEILYFEIVGFYEVKNGLDGKYGVKVEARAIMDPHPIKEGLKDIKKTYGDLMLYKYGLEYGKSDIYVYKIVQINEDGDAIDLGWNQVKKRCVELGLKHVPELMGPFVYHTHRDDPTEGWMEELVDGPSTLDSSHIREGVVLRVESPSGIEYVKNKSWTFGVLEGYVKDDEAYIDVEESS